MQIDGRAMTREAFASHVAGLTWTQFSPQVKTPVGVTLHNTWKPTLQDWSEDDPIRSRQLAGLKSYYEGMGWHAGPHMFISRKYINLFSPLTDWGIHSTCFNHDHIGIEMVGNYATGADQFATGDGAMVRDNAVFAVATLFNKLGLRATSLNFHHDCVADHHACPGNGVGPTDMIKRVADAMNTPVVNTPTPIPVTVHPYTVTSGDSLYSIAKRFGTNVATLAQVNNLEPPYLLQIGQVIKFA